MPNHTFILYVEDPLKSAEFYEKLLGAKPVDASPGFAVFNLAAPTMLGLWKRADVKPAASAPTGANELSFEVPTKIAVDSFFASAKSIGAIVLQEPTQMDFGYTFTVADPDGHRLRAFATS
jgi:catechol 2,3-dioxygenase-like lactoylglutathione lyase family enzyme